MRTHSALIVRDGFKNWIESYPIDEYERKTFETLTCLQRFLLPSQKLDIIYTDNSK